MEIAPLLNIERGITAIIGGGGKTTLLYALAEELKKKGSVIICTSTHIKIPEKYRLVTGGADEIKKGLESYGVICAGSIAKDDKITSPNTPFSELEKMADYILAEADGAKVLPLKAHAPYEPVIPENTNKTILVIGADGFFKPIKEVCHRSGLWASLAGTSVEDDATPEGEAEVINREGFGDMVFINKAESDMERKAAIKLSGMLTLPVLIGSLHKGEYEWI